MGKLLAATKEATGVLVAISLLVGLFFPPPTSVALISFMWIVRIASYFFGGWLYIKRVDRSILHASFTGPVLLFLEYFLIHGVLGVGEISNYFEVGMSVRMLELARFAIGFALFLPISMAIAALGAFMAKREP